MLQRIARLLPGPEGSSPTGELKGLLFFWLLLLFLGGIEFAASFVPMARSLRPLVMIPGVLMAIVVAIGFMDVGKGPAIVRAFAVAAVFWLMVLLGLGSVDPLTRTNYHVLDTPVESRHLP
jgi:cytochrome c oxidase subunit IV